jgi:glucose-6-phosphate 1-dehydrogenase
MIRLFADADELRRIVAEELCHHARQAIAARGRFVVALAGGSTPRPVYELLARDPCRGRVAWDRVDFFLGDERAVPPDHPASNYRTVHEALLGPLGVSGDRVHRIPPWSDDVDAAARAYEREIAQVFGVPPEGAPPAFDLVLLGLGRDGHTASLFPGSATLDEERRWVVAEPTTRPPRITLTAPILRAAREVWFLVVGGDKAEPLRAATADVGDPRRAPARLVGVRRDRAPTWFVDPAAARGLEAATTRHGIATRELLGPAWQPTPGPDPCAFVIFGATGDLTFRKLVPALYSLAAAGDQDGSHLHHLPEGSVVIGVSREALDADALRARLHDAVATFWRRKPVDEAVWRRLAARIDYVPGAFEDPATYARLAERLAAVERTGTTHGNRLYYLATPPQAFQTVVAGLHAAGLLYERLVPSARPWCRVAVEKPFGRDLASARILNEHLARYLDESQVFRVDHYLGKETVQNILVFRFGNTTFEPLWNRSVIDHVQITAAESIGVDGRGRFYDAIGAVRDMVQGHLLNVLALCASEVPVSLAPDDVRDGEVHLLRALRPITGRDVERQVVCAQYDGYRHEDGVDPHSRTPTYVAMKVLIDNWRWQGVPFYLRTGKKLARPLTEVSIHFAPVPLSLFPGDRERCEGLLPNVLTLRIQPDEGIALRFVAKVPGDSLAAGSVQMSMAYAAAFGRPLAEAYERLLLDLMRGDQTLFARRDVVEAAWAFVTPILEAWDRDPRMPLVAYAPGSPGPPEADELLARDGRRWKPLVVGAGDEDGVRAAPICRDGRE